VCLFGVFLQKKDMSYLVDFQPLALKAMRLEALLPTKCLSTAKDKVHIDRDTASFTV